MIAVSPPVVATEEVSVLTIREHASGRAGSGWAACLADPDRTWVDEAVALIEADQRRSAVRRGDAPPWPTA